MLKIISKTYKDIEILFSPEPNKSLYINATKIAKAFKKDLSNWRRSFQTSEYIKALLSSVNSTELTEEILFKVVLGKGKNQGTWIHKKLIIAFARWLSPEFAVWCDSAIEEILETGSYSISQTFENPLKTRTENLRFAGEQLLIFKKSFYEIGITQKEELAITSNRAVKNETEIDFIQLSGKSGIETLEKFFTVTEICQHIRNSSNFSESQKLSVSTKKNDKPQPKNLNLILKNMKFQEKIDGDWKATEKGKKFSKFVQNKSKYSNKTVYHTVWNLEVLKKIF